MILTQYVVIIVMGKGINVEITHANLIIVVNLQLEKFDV